jgi:hypothetical protein
MKEKQLLLCEIFTKGALDWTRSLLCEIFTRGALDWTRVSRLRDIVV